MLSVYDNHPPLAIDTCTCGKLPAMLALVALVWAWCAHTQLNPFYHPFYPDVTHVRKDTRPSPTFRSVLISKVTESLAGPGNEAKVFPMLHIMCLITKWGGRALFGLSVGLLALYTCISLGCLVGKVGFI